MGRQGEREPCIEQECVKGQAGSQALAMQEAAGQRPAGSRGEEQRPLKWSRKEPPFRARSWRVCEIRAVCLCFVVNPAAATSLTVCL